MEGKGMGWKRREGKEMEVKVRELSGKEGKWKGKVEEKGRERVERAE